MTILPIYDNQTMSAFYSIYCRKSLKAVVGFIFYNVLLPVFLWFEENKKPNFN